MRGTFHVMTKSTASQASRASRKSAASTSNAKAAQNTGPLRRRRAGFCRNERRSSADTAHFAAVSRSSAVFRSTKEFIKDTFLFRLQLAGRAASVPTRFVTQLMSKSDAKTEQ